MTIPAGFATATGSVLLFIEHHGYTALFIAATVQGPLVAGLSGVLVSLGHINLVPAFILLFTADIAGDIIFYWIGRLGGEAVLKRWEGSTPEGKVRELLLAGKFKKYDWQILFFGKMNPAGLVVLAAAGALRMDFGRFISLNALFAVFKIVLLMIIGINLGKSYEAFLTVGGAVSLVVGIALLFLYLYMTRREDVSRRSSALTKGAE